MSRKQFGYTRKEDFKRNYVLQELRKLGITEMVCGRRLSDCDYSELKWHLAMELVKREGAGE